MLDINLAHHGLLNQFDISNADLSYPIIIKINPIKVSFEVWPGMVSVRCHVYTNAVLNLQHDVSRSLSVFAGGYYNGRYIRIVRY